MSYKLSNAKTYYLFATSVKGTVIIMLGLSSLILIYGGVHENHPFNIS